MPRLPTIFRQWVSRTWLSSLKKAPMRTILSSHGSCALLPPQSGNSLPLSRRATPITWMTLLVSQLGLRSMTSTPGMHQRSSVAPRPLSENSCSPHRPLPPCGVTITCSIAISAWTKTLPSIPNGSHMSQNMVALLFSSKHLRTPSAPSRTLSSTFSEHSF